MSYKLKLLDGCTEWKTVHEKIAAGIGANVTLISGFDLFESHFDPELSMMAQKCILEDEFMKINDVIFSRQPDPCEVQYLSMRWVLIRDMNEDRSETWKCYDTYAKKHFNYPKETRYWPSDTSSQEELVYSSILFSAGEKVFAGAYLIKEARGIAWARTESSYERMFHRWAFCDLDGKLFLSTSRARYPVVFSMPVPLTKEEFDTLKLSDKKFFNYRSSWPDREFLTRDEQDAFVEGRYPNVRHLVAMLLEKAPEELRKTHAKNAFALVPESLRAIAGCKMTYGSFYIVADDGDLVPCSLCDGYLTSLSGKAIGIGGSRNGCFVFRYRNRYARVLPGISKGDGYFIGADYVGTYNFFDGEPICDGDDVYMFRRTNGSVFAPFLPFESIQSLVPVHSQKYFIGHETILLDGTKYVEMFLKNSKETSDSDPDF